MWWIRTAPPVNSLFDTAVTCRPRMRRSSPPPATLASPSRRRADARTKPARTTDASSHQANGSSPRTDRTDTDRLAIRRWSSSERSSTGGSRRIPDSPRRFRRQTVDLRAGASRTTRIAIQVARASWLVAVGGSRSRHSRSPDPEGTSASAPPNRQRSLHGSRLNSGSPRSLTSFRRRDGKSGATATHHGGASHRTTTADETHDGQHEALERKYRA